MIKAFNKDPMECELCKSKMILYEIMVKINGEAIYIDTKEKREYDQRKAEEMMMQTYELYRILGANGDISYAPRFTCEKCNGIMEPLHYEGTTGIIYGID